MPADHPQAEINPYASPIAVPPGSEAVVPAAMIPFGLDRPIHAAGRFSPRDMRQAVRLAFGGKDRFSWIIFPLGIAYLVWITWTFFSLFTSTLIVFALAMLGVNTLACRLYVRWGIRDLGQEEIQLVFSEDGYQVVAETRDTFCNWLDYSRCTCIDTIVILHHVRGFFFPVPRRFFGNDTDWHQFVALAQHKLPPKKGQPQLTPDVDLALQPVHPFADLSGRLGIRTILGGGCYTSHDLAIAGKYIPTRRLVRALIGGAFLIVMLPALVSLAMGYPAGSGEWLFLGVVLAAMGLIFVVIPRVRIRKLTRSSRSLFATHAIAVSDERVWIAGGLYRSMFLWSHFAGFRQLQDYVLLYYPSRNQAHVLPRSFFSEAAWPAVVALVERKLPRI